MKCQRCEAECPDDARKCPNCGRQLRKKPPGPDAEEALTPEAEAYFRRVRWVYFWALWSLLPPLGALLGPLAVVWALLVWRQGRVEWPGRPTLIVSLCLGLLAGGTQVAGLCLIASSW
jgi:hypothetical protein